LSGETIGTAFKTMFARISRSKSAADEDVTSEDMSDAAKAYEQLRYSNLQRRWINARYLKLLLISLSSKWGTFNRCSKSLYFGDVCWSKRDIGF
jgi:hypothetical protein